MNGSWFSTKKKAIAIFTQYAGYYMNSMGLGQESNPRVFVSDN